MKLPSFRRLTKGDYPQQFQDLVDKLAVSLNYGVEALYDALNNKLTFQDNLSTTIASVTLAVDANGTPATTTRFALISAQPTAIGLVVLSAINQDNPTIYPPAAVFASFSIASGQVTLTNVRGLTPGTNYTLRLLAV